MTTCRDVIEFATRQARIYGAGETTATADANDGLFVLQGMYQAWVAGSMFGELNDIYKTAAYTALEGDRVVTSGSPTITIPDSYAENGQTGSDRAPRELSIIQVVDKTAASITTNIYDRHDWVEIETLALGDDAPLAGYGKHGLAACLAIELAELFGASIGAGVKRSADRFLATIRDRRIGAADPESRNSTTDYP